MTDPYNNIAYLYNYDNLKLQRQGESSYDRMDAD